MWFRNLQTYRLPKNWAIQSNQLEEMLSRMVLQPCSASAGQSIGWVTPNSGDLLVHAVNHQWLIALGIEQKLLPPSVIRQSANDRAKAIEEAEGRRIGRKEMRDLRETITEELLPRAFVHRRVIHGWIDPINGWLVIDTAAAAKAEEFLEHLRKSVDSLPVSLLKASLSPSAAMTGWVASGEIPGSFTIDQDLELRSAENAVIRYARHSLEGEEIRQHIADGKVVTRLAMTWGDRISFVLDEKLQIKRLAFLDLLKEESENLAENEEERFDLDFTLMTGEVARLLNDLIEMLGGETNEGK